MNGINDVLTQNIASVVMAGVFIFYLTKRDSSTKQSLDSFNKSLQAFNRTLTNHLYHQLKVDTDLTKAFVNLSDLIRELIEQEKVKQ